jgi:hypothetical protein
MLATFRTVFGSEHAQGHRIDIGIGPSLKNERVEALSFKMALSLNMALNPD